MELHKISPQNFKISFETMILLIRKEMPYATEYDLFQIEAYQQYVPGSTQMPLQKQFAQFCNTQKQIKATYSMMSFLRLNYVFAPE
jgi:hypothetical protein